MPALRKMITAVAVAVGATTVVFSGPLYAASATGPDKPASAVSSVRAASTAAAPDIAVLRVTGNATLVDDDFDFDPVAFGPINEVFAVDSRGFDRSFEIKVPTCAGGEVRATVNLTFTYFSQRNVVFVRGTNLSFSSAALRMFEGASCSSNDLDGTATFTPFELTPGASGSFTLSTGNQDEGGNDRATVSLKVARTV